METRVFLRPQLPFARKVKTDQLGERHFLGFVVQRLILDNSMCMPFNTEKPMFDLAGRIAFLILIETL